MGLLGDIFNPIGRGFQAVGRGFNAVMDRGVNNGLLGIGIDPSTLTPQQRAGMRSQFLMNLGAGIQSGSIAAGASGFQQNAAALRQQQMMQQLKQQIAGIMQAGGPPDAKYRALGDLYSSMGAVDVASKYYDVAAKMQPPAAKVHGTQWVTSPDGKPTLQAVLDDGTTKALPGGRMPDYKTMDTGGSVGIVDMNNPSAPPVTSIPKTQTPGEKVQQDYYGYLQQHNTERDQVRDKQWQAEQNLRVRQANTQQAAANAPLAEPDPMSPSLFAAAGLSMPGFLALTGQTGSLGRGNVERQRAFNEAQSWAAKRGVDPSMIASQYKTYNQILGQNISRLNNTKIMEQELAGTVLNLKDVVKAQDLGRLKWGNVLKLWAGENVNDPLAAQYAMHLNQLRSELAAYNAATQGRSGSSVTVSDNVEAERTIQRGLSTGSLDGLMAAIESSTGKMGAVLEGSVKNTQSAIWGLFGLQAPSAASGPGRPQAPGNATPRINTKEEYDRLPSGAVYIDAQSGALHKKR